MDALREWAVGLCCAAVAATVMQRLVPKKGIGSVFRVLLTAFFLCVFTAPLLSFEGISQLDLSSLPNEVESGLLDEAVNRQLEVQVAGAVEEIVGSVLSSYGITAVKVETDTDIADDGGIYIASVQVTIPGGTVGTLALKQKLETRLGVPVSVATEG